MRSPLYIFQIPIVLSTDPDAKYSPFGENTTLLIYLEWPVSRIKEHTEKISILDINVAHSIFLSFVSIIVKDWKFKILKLFLFKFIFYVLIFLKFYLDKLI